MTRRFKDVFDTLKEGDPGEEVPQPQANRRKISGKYKDPNYTKVTSYLRGETYRGAKMVLLGEGNKKDFSELLEELVAEWLKSHQTK
jgi:hypothetical protein